MNKTNEELENNKTNLIVVSKGQILDKIKIILISLDDCQFFFIGLILTTHERAAFLNNKKQKTH